MPILNLSDMTGETVHVDYIHVHHVFVHIGGTWETGMGDMERLRDLIPSGTIVDHPVTFLNMFNIIWNI